VPLTVLRKIATARDVPDDLLAPAQRAIRSFMVAAEGSSRTDRWFVDEAWAELWRCSVRQWTCSSHPGAPPSTGAGSDRSRKTARGAELAGRLARRSSADRELLLAEEEYQGWAVSEHLAAESLRLAPNEPREALELAQLAVRTTERVPGEGAWRQRLQGYALAHLANARRAASDLPGAERDLALAAELWEAGAPVDPGLLNPALLPWIEAGLRKAQRRLVEAHERVEEALRLGPGELRGKLLITQSEHLAALGRRGRRDGGA
jgi:hypothetical protein